MNVRSDVRAEKREETSDGKSFVTIAEDFVIDRFMVEIVFEERNNAVDRDHE